MPLRKYEFPSSQIPQSADQYRLMFLELSAAGFDIYSPLSMSEDKLRRVVIITQEMKVKNG